MARTIGFLIYFAIHVFLTALAYLPYWVVRIAGGQSGERQFRIWYSRIWSRALLRVAGARVTVHGIENLPRSDRLCLIANHQSFADIVLVEGYIDKPIAFLAKASLKRVPLLNLWMRTFRCVFIERNAVRGASRVLETAARRIGEGVPLLFFPEGTRSKGGPMRAFKPGSMRIVKLARATIVPVTLANAAALFERHRRICRADVSVTIHPPFTYERYNEMSTTALSEELRAIIAGGLPPTDCSAAEPISKTRSARPIRR